VLFPYWNQYWLATPSGLTAAFSPAEASVTRDAGFVVAVAHPVSTTATATSAQKPARGREKTARRSPTGCNEELSSVDWRKPGATSMWGPAMVRNPYPNRAAGVNPWGTKAGVRKPAGGPPDQRGVYVAVYVPAVVAVTLCVPTPPSDHEPKS
jgi:uncharacterized protein (DUF2126 family)